jgi:hypothetical protein
MSKGCVVKSDNSKPNPEFISAWGRNDLMVTAAHRYCLGRTSYIVSECVEWLINIWPHICENAKERIVIETQGALEKNRAGDNCDAFQWQKLLFFDKTKQKLKTTDELIKQTKKFIEETQEELDRIK